MPALQRFLLAAGALFAGVLLSACSDSASDDDGTLNVEVGVVQSLSGGASAYGTTALRGIELAIDEINAADDGVRMTLSLADDSSDVEAGTQAFQILSDRRVAAIIGPTLSNVALAAMPVAQQAGVPVLGATTTAQGVTEIGDYVFRVALTEAVVVPATIERVHEESPIERTALIFDSTDAFSRSSADAMRQGIENIGASIEFEVDVSETPIEERLEELHGQELDAFLVTPLVEQSVPIVQALRGDGFEQIIIGGNSFNTPEITQAGDAVNGAYVGAAWNPGLESEASERFVEAYRERFDEDPDLFAAQGYSAVYVLLDAVKRADSTNHAEIRDALAEVSSVETPLGNISMSDRREALHDPVVQRIESGKLVALPPADN